MPENALAEKHSMDIPHVSAVELPLVVKNEQRAVAMLGGKSKIAKVINSEFKQTQPAGHSTDENVLELRLRKDPFHHPIQSLVNHREKVLLKVSIPKLSLPTDYYTNPSKYSVRELIRRNKDASGASHKVQPVGIINKSYLFKAMADFQVSTKNNKTVQEFNNLAHNLNHYRDVATYFEAHKKLQELPDFRDKKEYENRDLQLPPPPIFSNIRFPFDYKYQKNPLTTVLKDENGEIRVVSKKNRLKLHTIIVDFLKEEVPIELASELKPKLAELIEREAELSLTDTSLLGCIRWLQEVFELKPIWLRKQLEDIVPTDYKRSLKQALPYVTYIYKSGPWRFCNIKFGLNPRSDKKYWPYQSEYFRIPGLHIDKSANVPDKKVVPKTVSIFHPDSTVAVSEHLIFTGTKIPGTVTYQVGDIVDSDIVHLLNKAQREEFGFFRDTPDFQDGWISKQVLETVRRIIRYKLHQFVKEESLDIAKILKIINTDYTENENDMDIDNDFDETSALPAAQDDEDEENQEENAEIEEEILAEVDDAPVNEDLVMSRIQRLDSSTAMKLSDLVGFVKQDSL